MNMKVYVAGPYSSAPEKNTRKAIKVGTFLLQHGVIPFVPHFSHYFRLRQLDLRFWLDEYDLPWLSSCDALLRLPGESPGSDEEVAFAIEHDIPVFYKISEVIAWAKGTKRELLEHKTE